MTRASVLAALFCLALGLGPAEARPHSTGPAVTDDRFGHYGPVSRRHIAADGVGSWACLRQDPRARQRCGGKAKRYKNHAGRHHRRRAARIVTKIKAAKVATVAAVPIPAARPVPPPLPHPAIAQGHRVDERSPRRDGLMIHPFAWLAGEGPPPPSVAPGRPLPAPAEPAERPSILAEARRWLGKRAHQLGLPARLWCADFLNMVLRRAGFAGTGSRWAKSFARYGERLPGPKPGAIVVFHRGSPRSPSGHVGVVAGQCRDGRIRVVSGNHGRRVAEACYPKRRVVAYVAPRPKRIASQ